MGALRALINQQTESKTQSINPPSEDLQDLHSRAKSALKRREHKLPKEVRREHWIKVKSDPQAWRSVGLIFQGTPGLVEVQVLADIVSQLGGLLGLAQVEGKEPDLSLGKMRN